jgi:hypothetical protein
MVSENICTCTLISQTILIFHKHKAIFFHAGKTAGTSIEKMVMPNHKLSPHEENRDLMFGTDKELKIFLQHATCKTTKDVVPQPIFEDYFKFSVVRNPFSRAVSCYYYLLKQHRRKYGEFSDFVQALPELSKRPRLQRGSHYICQTHYTHIDGEQVVDYIGRFENLGDVEARLNRQWNTEYRLPRKNSRKKPGRPEDISELYDEESMSIIRATYKDDFETFGYDDQFLPV